MQQAIRSFIPLKRLFFWRRRELTPAETKAREISRRYKVTFSRDAEVAYRVSERDDNGYIRQEPITCRTPTLEELVGIEAALTRADPSHQSIRSYATVKFYFLARTDPRHLNAVAWFVPRDRKGNPAVYFSPGFSEKRLPTEAHAETAGEQRRNTIEAVTIHELAHNGQHNTGWHDPQRRWQVAQKLGWVEGTDQAGDPCWYLKSRGGDLFRRDPSGLWLRRNPSGHYLDSRGRVVDANQAFRRSPSALRKIAMVRPVSLYFTTPIEMGAEGMLAFRLSKHHRGMLLRDCRALYNFVKSEDEREIRLFYGTDESGITARVRMPNGVLAANTQENRQQVQQFEDDILQWRRFPISASAQAAS